MRRWVKSYGLMACLWCSSVFSAGASDAIVQDFGGWKITIQPGPTKIPAPVSTIPLTRNSASSSRKVNDASVVGLASFNQADIPPAPEGVIPPPAPLPMPPAPSPEISPPASVASGTGVVVEPNADGLPIIVPGESSQCCDPTPIVSPPEGTVDTRYLSQRYAEIYKSIPFIRAEYDANPSYIHDTAVEFTFGKMRPTTIVRGNINMNQNSPYSYGGYGLQYGYGGYGYGYGFGGYPSGLAYPPIQLVVPGTGLRIHRSY